VCARIARGYSGQFLGRFYRVRSLDIASVIRCRLGGDPLLVIRGGREDMAWHRAGYSSTVTGMSDPVRRWRSNTPIAAPRRTAASHLRRHGVLG